MSLVFLNNWAQAKIILTTVRQSVSKSRLILSLFPFQVFVETTFGPSTTSPITTVTAVHGKYLRIQHLVYGFRVNYSRTSMARTLMALLPRLCELVLESLGKIPWLQICDSLV